MQSNKITTMNGTRMFPFLSRFQISADKTDPKSKPLVALDFVMNVTFREWIGANILFKRVEFLLPFSFKLVLSTAALLRGVSCKISSSTVCISAFILETFSLSRTLTGWIIKGDKSRSHLSIIEICPSSQSFIRQHSGKSCLFDAGFFKFFAHCCVR